VRVGGISAAGIGGQEANAPGARHEEKAQEAFAQEWASRIREKEIRRFEDMGKGDFACCRNRASAQARYAARASKSTPGGVGG